MSVRANFADIYLRGMHNRSMRIGKGYYIQPTDWSTAREQGKLVLVAMQPKNRQNLVPKR